MREVDPEARRLIAAVLELEAAPWPDAMPAYAEATFALALRCEFRPGKAELYRWACRALAPVLRSGPPEQQQCRFDALADAVTLGLTTLLRFRAGLHASRRPNLRSMLRAMVIWKGNDRLESMYRRHRRRAVPVSGAVAEGVGRDAVSFERVWLGEVLDALADEGELGRAVLMVGEGVRVARASRRTGVSRQQIYRAQARLRVRFGVDEGEGRDDPTGARS